MSGVGTSALGIDPPSERHAKLHQLMFLVGIPERDERSLSRKVLLHAMEKDSVCGIRWGGAGSGPDTVRR